MDYKSAHDLPSFLELSTQLKSFKVLRHLIPKTERPDMDELERQLRYLGDTVDEFYRVLGPRNWIFHDSLPVDYIAELLTSPNVDDVETGLITHYNTPENLTFLMGRLWGLPAMGKRKSLLVKARDDFYCERYYACIHVLLSVMDGFVNEFETVRRGLHAREAEELKAWDSVVGHHMGLTNAHKTFTRAKSATNEEPIFELYRNGIVHGSQLNYDNVVVATKAWNRLFAVDDWARATLKEKQPAPTRPSWKGLLAQIAENDKRRRAAEAWQPSQVFVDEAGFAQHPAMIAADLFLASWVQQNYGQMAQSVSTDTQTANGAAMPRKVRLEYEPFRLGTYTIIAVDHAAAAICIVTVELGFEDGSERVGRMRWIYEDTEGKPVASSLPGTWRLLLWGPYTFLEASR